MLLRGGTLFAQRFDARRLEVVGDPVRIASPAGSYLDYETNLVCAAPLQKA